MVGGLARVSKRQAQGERSAGYDEKDTISTIFDLQSLLPCLSSECYDLIHVAF